MVETQPIKNTRTQYKINFGLFPQLNLTDFMFTLHIIFVGNDEGRDWSCHTRDYAEASHLALRPYA